MIFGHYFCPFCNVEIEIDFRKRVCTVYGLLKGGERTRLWSSGIDKTG